MKHLLLIFAIVLHTTITIAQTNVSGGIFKNTIWTKANSPYLVTGDIAVYPGFTLTVEPGVIVKVGGNFKIIIRGGLIAKGTINDSIQFVSSAKKAAKSNWLGFQIENDLGGKVEVAYFKGSDAEHLFKTNGNSSGEVLNITHSKFSNNNIAIMGTDGASFSVKLTNSLFYDNNLYAFLFSQNATIENCIFKKGNEGIFSGGMQNLVVKNCEFSEFAESAIRLGGTYINCKFFSNTNGIKLFPDLHLKDCEIYNNINGIVTFYPFMPQNYSFINTCVYNNTTYDVKHSYNYNIDLTQISWKADSLAITNKIYDAYDNVNLGIVAFNATRQCNVITNTDNEETMDKITIYPNPFTLQTTLKTTQILKNANVALYNSLGQLVKQINNISDQTIVIDRDNLPSGIYSIWITEEDKIFKIHKITITDN